MMSISQDFINFNNIMPYLGNHRNTRFIIMCFKLYKFDIINGTK